jgi:2-polyprenyl-3-methyl-5-hydroxy-6-metoxy-1,4-benzoquinol methylase
VTDDVTSYWNDQAKAFDDEPDHGLRDPAVRRAWTDLLAELVPGTSRRVADLGCGTGSLSTVLAQQGHRVTGIDLAPAMVEQATAKAARLGLDATFAVGDAGAPDLPAATFDVVLSRHVVWALPDPQESLRRWTDLLTERGRLVLVEGYWFTEAGLHADELLGLLDARLEVREVRRLDDPAYWGKPVSDERYVVVADLA